MGFFDSLARFAGNATGGFIGDSDAERRRRQQAAESAARQNALAATRPSPLIAPGTARSAPAATPLTTRTQAARPQALRVATRPNGEEDELDTPGYDVVAPRSLSVIGEDIGKDDFTAAPSIDTRKNTVKQGMRNNREIREIASMAGLAEDEVQQYINDNQSSYKRKTGLQQIGGVVNAIGESIATTVGAPVITMDRGLNADQTNATINQLNDQYQQGRISKARLQQEFNTMTKGVIGGKLKVTDKGVEKKTNLEDITNFAGHFTEAAVNAFPGASGAAAGIAAPAKVAFKTLVTSSVKRAGLESAFTGTGGTLADLAQDRGISVESVLLNYGGDFIFNSGGEISTAGLKKLFAGMKADPNLPPETVKKVMENIVEADTTGKITPEVMQEVLAVKPKANKKAAAAITKTTDDYDTSLQKLDEELESGRITNDEHEQMENELFARASERGEVMAEDGKGIDANAQLEAIKARMANPTDAPRPENPNAAIAAVPVEEYLPRLAQKFGLQPATAARLLNRYKGDQASLHTILEANADNIAGAKIPDAYATKIINEATAASQTAAVRGGVAPGRDLLPGQPEPTPEVDPVVKAETLPELEAAPVTAAPTPKPIDAGFDPNTHQRQKDGSVVNTETGEIVKEATSKPVDNSSKAPVTKKVEPKVAQVTVERKKAETPPTEEPAPVYIKEEDYGKKGSHKTLIKNAPKKGNVTEDEFNAIVTQAAETYRARAEQLAKDVKAATGVDWRTFVEEIQHKSFDASYQISKKVDAFYKSEVKPMFDDAYKFSGLDKKGGFHEYYMPTGGNSKPEMQSINDIFLDASMIHDDGFIKTRTGAAVTGADGTFNPKGVNASPEVFTNYATAAFSAPYRKAMQINNAVKTAETPITTKQAEAGIKKIETHAKKIVDTAKASKISRLIGKQEAVHKVNTVGAMADAGTALGKTKYTVVAKDAGVLKAGNILTEDWRRMRSWTFTTKSGKKTNILEAGVEQYERAHSYATQHIKDGAAKDNDYLGVFTSHLKDQYPDMPAAERAAVLGKLDRDLDKVAYTRLNVGDDMADDYLMTVMMRAEKNAARVNFAETLQHLNLPTTDHTAKRVRGIINYHANRMLVDGQVNRSIGEAISQTITGTFYRGLLGYSPQSALVNLTETQRVLTFYGAGKLKDAAKGINPKVIMDTIDEYGNISNSHGAKDFISQNATLFEQALHHVQQNGAVKFGTKALDPMMMFNATETLKNVMIIKAAEAHHMKAGLSGMKLRKAVMDDFREIALQSGGTNVLGLNRSPGMKLLTQFWQWPIRNVGNDARLLLNKSTAGNYAKGDVNVGKTLATIYGQRTLIFLALNGMYGASAAYAFGAFDPAGLLDNRWDGLDDEDRTGVDKAVDLVPTSPFTGTFKDLYFTIRAEQERAEGQPKGEYGTEGSPTFDPMNVVKDDKTIRSGTNLLPGGNQIGNRTLGYKEDRDRGYNESADGRVRFATPEKGSFEDYKAFVFGKNTTPEAREYFGSANPMKALADGDFIGFGKELIRGLSQLNPMADKPNTTDKPIGKRYQDKVAALAHEHKDDPKAFKDAINGLIGESKAQREERETFFTQHPQVKAGYEALTKTTWNPETKKHESDVISPDRWKTVQGDTTGKLYQYLKASAERNNKNFGDPIDPVYKLKNTEQVKQILAIRASFTGDDDDIKKPLYSQKWYKDFQKEMSSFYTEKTKREKDPSSDYGSTKRAQEYFDLSQAAPQQSALYQQYQDIRYGNEEKGIAADEAAGKAFFKANADTLVAEGDKYDQEKLNWINKMRGYEGAPKFDDAAYWAEKEKGKSSFTPWAKRSGYGSGDGSGSTEGNRSGVGDSLTTFSKENNGLTEPKLAKNKMKNVRTAVKHVKRASGSSPIRIKI